VRSYLTPTGVATSSKCLHYWHLECFGNQSRKLPLDAGMRLIIERGIEREREVVSSLTDVAAVEWDGKDWDAGQRSTVELMREGRPWIYQGVLLHEKMRGRPDLLKKVAGPSRLGSYSYLPVDIKGHKEVVKKDRYQLQSYADMLEPILGHRPREGAIWLNTGEVAEVDLSNEQDEYSRLRSSMDAVMNRQLRTEGYRCGECGQCPWLGVCSQWWKESEHACLLYGVTGDTARKFSEVGLGSWRKVADSTPGLVAEKLDWDEERARRVWLAAQAWKERSPKIIRQPRFPTGLPIHFYDIETHDDVVYLHGDIRVMGDQREERQFTARRPSDEKKVWHEFLDFLARDTECIVYCWADYERGFADSLWRKYGGNEAGWKHLENSLVDQCRFVRDHFALPASGYGIKKVAPLFGFKWAADDAGGLNSESWYGDWLRTEDEAVLRKILRYNLDDVVAMEVIHRALEKHVKSL